MILMFHMTAALVRCMVKRNTRPHLVSEVSQQKEWQAMVEADQERQNQQVQKIHQETLHLEYLSHPR